MKDDLRLATFPGFGVSHARVDQEFQQIEQRVARMLEEFTPGREGSAAFYARLRTAARLQPTATTMTMAMATSTPTDRVHVRMSLPPAGTEGVLSG